MSVMRFFRAYWNGMNLQATVAKNPFGGYVLDVWTVDDGKKHPYFDERYKDERGALRAMKTRFRGAEWEEYGMGE